MSSRPTYLALNTQKELKVDQEVAQVSRGSLAIPFHLRGYPVCAVGVKATKVGDNDTVGYDCSKPHKRLTVEHDRSDLNKMAVNPGECHRLACPCARTRYTKRPISSALTVGRTHATREL